MKSAWVAWGLVSLCWLIFTGCASPSGTQDETGASISGVNNTQNESDARRRARLRVSLAMEYFANRQYAVALEELRNAQTLDATFADVYNAFALVYMELNETRLAEESFQRALRLAPNDSELNNNYGWFLCQSGQAQRSIALFETALRNPLYATPGIAARNAGICALRANNVPLASDYLQRAFRFDPGNALTMYYLAEVLYRQNDLDKARFYVTRLNQQTEPSAAGLWLAIKIERKRGDRLSEEVLAGQLRRRFPDSREALAYQRGEFND